MSADKFSPVTSSLLVRKGEAVPSQLPRGRARPSANGGGKPGTDAGGRKFVESPGGKPRRLTFTLTPHEYETLGLVAERKGVTRQDLAQSAMNAYLEWLISERGEG